MKSYYCQPYDRRRFLQQVSGGFGALAMEALTRANARAESHEGRQMLIDPIRPFAPRLSNFAPKAKSVIFLHMVGGPSQLDTFDYKPLLKELDGQPVPKSFRRAVEASKFHNIFTDCKDLMASPFAFKQYGQTGKWVSELFPKVAEHVDDLCFIHSMQADSNNHAPACYQLHTGETVVGKASIGSWVTYGLGTLNESLPGYVVLFEAGPYGGPGNYGNGVLPPAFQPTRLKSQGSPVLNLTPPEQLAGGQKEAMEFINRLNVKHRTSRPNVAELDARIASYELAYRMQTAALEVGDVESESPAMKSSYGLDHEDQELVKFGRKCLLARRLVERGVRFVQVYSMYDKDGWDAHTGLPENHQRLARQSDQPVAALLADLKQRGLLDETLVVWAGEFGRTPMMQLEHGRQHNAAGFTVWMAGGGVMPGSIGATDEIGIMATEQPYGFKDLHATILAALGLDNELLSFQNGARDERLTGILGNASVIPGVLG